MKKIIYGSLFAGLMFASCTNPTETPEYKALMSEKDSLETVLNQKSNEANDYLSIINEVEQNLEQIRIAQNQVASDQYETSSDARTRIQNNINTINTLLAENKAKLAELDKIKGQNSALKKNIEQLKQRISEKEQEVADLQLKLQEKDIQIGQLNSNLDALNKDMSNLSAAKQQVDQVANEQDAALNTAYYLIGTKKELKNKGINISKQNFSKAAFTKVDIRDLKSIDLKSKAGTVLTVHPTSSYKINVVNKNATLEITNQKEFWSVSKYLVVQVK